MARLPEPGGDEGQWGGILNDFLQAAHTSGGLLKNNSVSTDTLQNNSVTAVKIATPSAPSAGEVLTYSGAGLTWAAPEVPEIPEAPEPDLDASDITSGVFDAARLPNASETTKGAVQLASTAEVVTGTDTTKAVTAAGVAAAITAVANPVIFVDSLSDIPAGTPVDTLVIIRAA